QRRQGPVRDEQRRRPESRQGRRAAEAGRGFVARKCPAAAHERSHGSGDDHLLGDHLSARRRGEGARAAALNESWRSTSMRTREDHPRTWRGVVGGAALVTVVAGGWTTQQVKVAEMKTSGKAPTYCPFLGPELCAKLTPTETPGRFSTGGGEPVMSLRYVNPDAHWTQYKKVMIAPVSFWAGDDTSVSQADQQALTNYFAQALNDALSKKFPIVRKPGPGVMEVQVAIDDIGKAVPVLRSVSMVIPQARVLATLKYVATGTYAFVGSAQAE